MKNALYFILPVMLLGAVNLNAQSDSAFYLSLKEAQNYALENNRSVLTSKKDLEIAKKQIWETTAIGLPQFSIDATYQHLFNIPEFSFPVSGFTQNPLTFEGDVPEGFSQFNSIGGINQYMYQSPDGFPVAEKDNATFDFTLSQLIFSGEYLVGLQASKTFKELSEKTLLKTEKDIRESITGSYYTVLVLDETLKVNRQMFDAVSQSQFEVNQMYEQGMVSETDADRLVILKSQLQNAINTLEGQREISKKLLLFQLGMDISNRLNLTDSIRGLVNETNMNLMNNVDFDVNKNVNYQLALTSTALSGLSLKREKSKFLPSVAGFYRHQELAKEPAVNFQPKDVVGVSISYPIFTSGQRLSVVSQARLEFEKSKLAQVEAEQGLIIQFEMARNDYTTAYENYLVADKNFELARKIFNRSLISFREGVTTSLELINNQREFLTAENEYINSMNTLLNAKATLDNLLNQDINYDNK